MVYYCEDCRHIVGSITSAKVHHELGHTVTLLGPSSIIRDKLETIVIQSVGKLRVHDEMPFASLVQCTSPHPNLPRRRDLMVSSSPPLQKSCGSSRT